MLWHFRSEKIVLEALSHLQFWNLRELYFSKRVTYKTDISNVGSRKDSTTCSRRRFYDYFGFLGTLDLSLQNKTKRQKRLITLQINILHFSNNHTICLRPFTPPSPIKLETGRRIHLSTLRWKKNYWWRKRKKLKKPLVIIGKSRPRRE